MLKNMLIGALTVYALVMTFSLHSVLNNIRSERKEVVMAKVDPEVAPFVGSYLQRLQIQSELQPHNPVMQQRFASISITFKNIVTMDNPGRSVEHTCLKEGGKMKVSLQMPKKNWEILNSDQKQYLIDITLDSCVSKPEQVATTEPQVI